MTAPRSCVSWLAHQVFLVPLDEHGHWYRYHHLFSDLLRTRPDRTVDGAGREPAPACLSLVQCPGPARRSGGAGVARRAPGRRGEPGAKPFRRATAGRAERRHVAALENGLARQPADQHAAPDRALQLGVGAGLPTGCRRGAGQPSEPLPAGPVGHRAEVHAGAMAGPERDHRSRARQPRTDAALLHAKRWKAFRANVTASD